MSRAPGEEERELAAARVGETLRDKWRLDRLIGFGGMAAVYEATHRNGMRGAVKLLHPELIRSADAKARFLREGYVANTVGHKGAVAVLDDDTTESGQVYLVMELLEGATLERIAEESPSGTLDAATVLRVADELLDVLAAAHEKGIVHRDLKPENLFLTKDGSVRVLDFGIARLRQSTSGPATATRTGDSMGTPAFMPPEQALGNWSEVDGRTDLWAVGATMFTLLTGRLVHDADTVQKVMLAAMTKPAPSLATVGPGLPAELVEVVDRALARERDERWPDARAMQTAVRAARSALDRRPVAAIFATRAASASEAALAASLGGAATLDVHSAVPPVSAAARHARFTAPPVSSHHIGAERRSPGSRIALAIAGLAVLAGGAFATARLLRPSTKAPSEPRTSLAAAASVVSSSTERAAPPPSEETSAPPLIVPASPSQATSAPDVSASTTPSANPPRPPSAPMRPAPIATIASTPAIEPPATTPSAPAPKPSFTGGRH